MARKRRIRFEGAYYHVFNRGVNKERIYFAAADEWYFLDLLRKMSEMFHVKIFAYCLMDNHYHLFLQTPLGNIDVFMKRLQGEFAQKINHRHKRVGPLFQGRYQSPLVDVDAYALTLTRYIHLNPMEIGLHPESYPWSSYQKYLGKKESWIDTSLILGMFENGASDSVESFQNFHR